MSSGISDIDRVRVNLPALIALGRYSYRSSLSSNRALALQRGNYQSSFQGRGMEYDESRLYQAGDDIRNLDWRVTARSGKAHTKLFHEERERPMFLWVDYRPSMFFATRGRYKSVMVTEIAALLAWRAYQCGDRVGGVIFSGDSHHECKPKRGKSAVLGLIRQLANHPAWQQRQGEDSKQASERALLRLARVVHPGSLLFLLSDFRSFSKRAELQLCALSRHNEVVMVLTYDPLEQALPAAGRYAVCSGDRRLVIETHGKQYRANYQRQFEQRRAHLKELSRAMSFHYLECSTEDDPRSVMRQGLYVR